MTDAPTYKKDVKMVGGYVKQVQEANVIKTFGPV
jgi:hypothetical protein